MQRLKKVNYSLSLMESLLKSFTGNFLAYLSLSLGFPLGNLEAGAAYKEKTYTTT